MKNKKMKKVKRKMKKWKKEKKEKMKNMKKRSPSLLSAIEGVTVQGVSSNRRVFKQLFGRIFKNRPFLGCFVKFWSEFCKCCFWVFRLIGGFLSISAKHMTVLKTCQRPGRRDGS